MIFRFQPLVFGKRGGGTSKQEFTLSCYQKADLKTTARIVWMEIYLGNQQLSNEVLIIELIDLTILVLPIGSMGMVYIPTFGYFFTVHVGKYTIHGSSGLLFFFEPSLSLLQDGWFHQRCHQPGQIGTRFVEHIWVFP